MTNIETIETLIDEAKDVQARLEGGKLSNTVARTLLKAIKIRLDGFKTNMSASALGCDIKDHALHEANRQTRMRPAA